MTTRDLHIHKYSNGLVLVAEPMEGVQSAAFSLLIPCGAVQEKEDKLGLSNLTFEMLTKGTKLYSSKELSDECERIGLQKGIGSGMEASSFSAQVLGDNLKDALNLCFEIIQNPTFPEDEVDSVRSLALQDLDAIEDEPASKIMDVLTKEYYPKPFSRSTIGTREGLENINVSDIIAYKKDFFLPDGAILSVAGKFNWEEIRDHVGTLISDWHGKYNEIKISSGFEKRRVIHEKKESAQLQIALAYPSVFVDHPDYYNARVWVNVLSGGMSGRLFIEVREKRGLVYRVGASHNSIRGRSNIVSYAGTTPENGEECLEVMLNELKGGIEISQDELNRSKVDLKTRVIMQTESSLSRASSIGHDLWTLGRVRTTEEIKAGIQNVTKEGIESYLKNFGLEKTTLVVLGEKELSLNL